MLGFDRVEIIFLQVVLIVGGAQEALYARPGNFRIVLNKRKGFVKIAIQTGTALVPVISFGENDLLEQPANDPGTWVRAYLDFFKKWTGVVPLLIYGRGFWENSIGMLPYRRQITTVVGAPLSVMKNPNPSQDEVNELHAKFVVAVTKLFDDNKDKYLMNPEKAKLIIE